MTGSLLHVVCYFLFCCGVGALSIYRDSMQKPLASPSDITPSTISQATSVILGFTSFDCHDERYVEISLRERFVSGANFPARLKAAKIVAVVDVQRRAIPLEHFDHVRCIVTPVFSVGERAQFGSTGIEEPVWPSFALRDGTVHFDISTSRWFLAGREIDSFECR
ncbi:hypothetical protein B0J11DRAFT_13043 [Dendryphion nanum]|uniref:Uncharacterized protein n=1 Tax=Dendryphion nanum TaxID=256645 RepID=A0A9P9EJP0_9PLEO|nr:hypothetical protein B0J11DRAFT_13043 [Dendryphion nanum]